MMEKEVGEEEGVSIKERKLLKVNDRILFQTKADYLKILPDRPNWSFHQQRISEISQDFSKGCSPNNLLS